MAREIIREDIPKIRIILREALGNEEYTDISRMGGLTNHTYRVTTLDGAEYAVRVPGEGTEELINRAQEKISTQLAHDLGVDAPLLYFSLNGSKLTRYIPNAVTMSAVELRRPERIRQVAGIFKKMHGCGVDTGVPFEVFDMADGYEKIIRDKQVPMYSDYQEIKAQVMAVKKEIDALWNVKKVPCHNDSLCENWVEGDGRMYLIDWEYAGMNDAMWDLADVSIEAEYDAECDQYLLTCYMDRNPGVADMLHFLANKIYVDYLWTLWAKARVPYDGQPMEDWATERYARMKGFLNEYKNTKETNP